MVLTEAELQSKLNDIIKAESLLDNITGIDELEKTIKNEKNIFIPSFLIDFKLNHRYVNAAKSIINSFSLYDQISGGSIKNISLEKSERLYPDYLLNNPETGQLLLWELKKDKQTEREAVTELLAYALEIKNHLPLIPNSDIKLVIVSTKFNTLLEHAISMVLLGTNFDILCLKANIVKNELKLSIHYPSAWSAIWQYDIPAKAFSSVSLMLEKKPEAELSLQWIKQIYNTSTDLIEFEGNKIGSSGFSFFWYNSFDEDISVPFGITICQINPYFFLQQSIDNGFKHNSNGPLAKYIIENESDFGTYYHPDSITNIANSARTFLNQYFRTYFEGFNNLEVILDPYCSFRGQALPTIVGSWGDVGDYFRYFYLKSCTDGASYFTENELKLEKAYKEPVVAFQIINVLTDRSHFKNGVFNFSAIYRFLKLLTSYSHICKIGFKSKNESEVIRAKLFYYSTELIGATKEIEYRISSFKHKISNPPLLSIFVHEAAKDIEEEINSFLIWLKEDFIGKENAMHHYVFNKLLLWCQFLNDDNLLKKALKKAFKDLDSDIGEFVKDYCKNIIEEAYIEKSSSYPFDIKPYLESILSIQINEKKIIKDSIFKEIDAIANKNLVDVFESMFLDFMDKTSSELFHELTDDIDFNSIDWKHLKDELVKRHKEGFKHTMVKITNNGEFYIGNLPEEKRFMGEIKDPKKEVFVEIDYSGFSSIHRWTWEEIISGKAFESHNSKKITNK
ncbi:MAG: hypothetical protein C0448_06935 [Sphingobacteriaceae bacterium]|nr:hypothetical protein [Sphingobacteriaceae bacterium]